MGIWDIFRKNRQLKRKVLELEAEIACYEARAASLNAFINTQTATAQLQQQVLEGQNENLKTATKLTAWLALYAHKTFDYTADPAFSRLYREARAEIDGMSTDQLKRKLQQLHADLPSVTRH